MRIPRLLLTGLVTAALVSCNDGGPFEVAGWPSHTISIALGASLDIDIGTAGPGSYYSPPAIVGPAVEFLSAGHFGTTGGPPPGGDPQQFHFRGIGRGRSIITFHHTDEFLGSGINLDVTDTVIVR